MKKSTFIKGLFVLLFVVAGALAGVVLVRQALDSPLQDEKPVQGVSAVEQEEFQLYFGAKDGSHLQAESRTLPACEQETLCVQKVLQALAAGSKQEGLAVLPHGTEILSIKQRNGVVSADFSSALIQRHPGGTLSELLTVYGVVNTVAVNFPHLRQVRFLVSGQPIDTLRGHVMLGEPVSADFSYSKPPFTGEVKDVSHAQ